MNYINKLNEEERKTLCAIISGRDFKKYFTRNEQEFTKIRKGFRAKSLSDEQALSIALLHLDKPFISAHINAIVEAWLGEIKQNIELLEKDTLSHDAAIAITLCDSFFAENVDLYLKLAGVELAPDARAALNAGMEAIRFERSRNDIAADEKAASDAEIDRLRDLLKAAESDLSSAKEKYESKIKESEKEIAELSSALSEARARAVELEENAQADEANSENDLAEFDDTNDSALPAVGAENIVSMCCVASESGRKWLMRCADLSYDGQYHIFYKSNDSRLRFANRDRIFYKDGPDEEDFYGTWEWRAIPNRNDPSKDYVSSSFRSDLTPIEIVIFPNVSRLNEISDRLKAGCDIKLHSRKTMFSYYASEGKYVGFLCYEKDIVLDNGRISLSRDCITLPVYEFSTDDIIRLNDRIVFLKKAFAGVPDRLYDVKNPAEVAKEVVLSAISWSACKARGLTKADYKTQKDFLAAIPTAEVTEKIKSLCRCSVEIAEGALNEFLSSANKYIDGDSIEDEILASSVAANKKLQARAKALVREDWEAENKALIDAEQRKLNSLKESARQAEHDLAEAKSSLENAKSEERRIRSVISEKEKLADKVEQAVEERIQKARKNAADFIADMAFTTGQPTQIAMQGCNKITRYSVTPTYGEPDELEANHSWPDAINTAAIELGEAGVAEKYRYGLAAYLSAAYIEKQPIILIGPNAIDILKAFSAAVDAQRYGMLCCDGSFDDFSPADIGAEGENIVIINNLITSSWINRLPEIISNSGVFYAATHPYAEDIRVEPKSLYSYMLPLFTEPLIEEKASGEYLGGFFADDFEDHPAHKGAAREPQGLSKLGLSPLVRNGISRIAATMHAIYQDATAEDDFLFSVFPMAYATLSTGKTRELIEDQAASTVISADLAHDLLRFIGDQA